MKFSYLLIRNGGGEAWKREKGRKKKYIMINNYAIIDCCVEILINHYLIKFSLNYGQFVAN